MQKEKNMKESEVTDYESIKTINRMMINDNHTYAGYGYHTRRGDERYVRVLTIEEEVIEMPNDILTDTTKDTTTHEQQESRKRKRKNNHKLINKLKREIKKLERNIHEADYHDANYYFCDLVVKYMNANTRKDVATRKNIRTFIGDMMTMLKLQLPDEVITKLGQFDDQDVQPQIITNNFYAPFNNNGSVNGDINHDKL